MVPTLKSEDGSLSLSFKWAYLLFSITQKKKSILNLGSLGSEKYSLVMSSHRSVLFFCVMLATEDKLFHV